MTEKKTWKKPVVIIKKNRSLAEVQEAKKGKIIKFPQIDKNEDLSKK